MRTTVSIDDQLLDRAKRRARQRGLTLGQVLEEALQIALAVERDREVASPVPVFRGGTGLAAGVDPSTRGLLEAIEAGLPVERMR